ncbi:MAG TPA: hypothetical protein VH372_20020 [Actinospica sp.]|jgi:PHD/YefM family antitoxin component YafN of YafNO toxin-antitoxin module|nr:hypothetical protein [Actinospica sp.]
MSREISPQPEERVSVTFLQTSASAILENISARGADADPVFITRRHEPLAVLVSLEVYYDYCALLALEQRNGKSDEAPGSGSKSPSS